MFISIRLCDMRSVELDSAGEPPPSGQSSSAVFFSYWFCQTSNPVTSHTQTDPEQSLLVSPSLSPLVTSHHPVFVAPRKFKAVPKVLREAQYAE